MLQIDPFLPAVESPGGGKPGSSQCATARGCENRTVCPARVAAWAAVMLFAAIKPADGGQFISSPGYMVTASVSGPALVPGVCARGAWGFIDTRPAWLAEPGTIAPAVGGNQTDDRAKRGLREETGYRVAVSARDGLPAKMKTHESRVSDRSGGMPDIQWPLILGLGLFFLGSAGVVIGALVAAKKGNHV